MGLKSNLWSARLVAASMTALVAGVVGCSQNSGARCDASGEQAIVHQVTEADLAYARSEEPVESNAAVLWVNGLGCPLCATNIDHQLKRVKGVGKIDVDLSIGKVDVVFKPGETHPSPSRLGEAVEEAGFTLVRIEKR